jgi:hypothetical protein
MYPGFPVEIGGAEQDHAAFFERKPHTRSWLVLRSRKSGIRWSEHGHPCRSVGTAAGLMGRPAVSHISRKTSKMAPNFLYAALERTACAALFMESRMKLRELTKLHRKPGVWATRRLLRG